MRAQWGAYAAFSNSDIRREEMYEYRVRGLAVVQAQQRCQAVKKCEKVVLKGL